MAGSLGSRLAGRRDDFFDDLVDLPDFPALAHGLLLPPLLLPPERTRDFFLAPARDSDRPPDRPRPSPELLELPEFDFDVVRFFAMCVTSGIPRSDGSDAERDQLRSIVGASRKN